MYKKSFFGLLGAVLLSASSWAFASASSNLAGVSALAYDMCMVQILPAIDRPAEHVPVVADISHTAVTPIMGIVANWQPGGGNVAYKLLIPKQLFATRLVRRIVASHSEVGWQV